MRRRLSGILTFIVAPVLVLVVLQGDQAIVVAALAAVALAAVIGVRAVGVRTLPGRVGIGQRAARHRNLDARPTPAHPLTAGRRQARAPARSMAVA